MKTNCQMIVALNKVYGSMDHIKGILTWEEVELINKMLCLKEMDLLQLRNLRDFVVCFFTSVDDGKEPQSSDHLDRMSAITTAIDIQILAQIKN